MATDRLNLTDVLYWISQQDEEIYEFLRLYIDKQKQTIGRLQEELTLLERQLDLADTKVPRRRRIDDWN